MRTFTTQHTVYTFDELTPETQEKVLDNLRTINIEDVYWYYDEMLEDLAREYGIELAWSDLCFDLDRSNYLYLDNHDHDRTGKTSYIDNMTKFLKKAGIDLRTRDAKQLLNDGFTLATKHYGGGDGRNYIEEYSDISADTEEKLQSCIDELTDTLKKYLREQYYSLMEDDCVKETIYANEYEFYEDGRIA